MRLQFFKHRAFKIGGCLLLPRDPVIKIGIIDLQNLLIKP